MKFFLKGKAVIEHADTAERFEIERDQLKYKTTPENPNAGMGPTLVHIAYVEHDELGYLEWRVPEYPVEVAQNVPPDCGKHKIIQDFDYGLEHEPGPQDGDE